MAEFLAWFCREVAKDNFYIGSDLHGYETSPKNVWVDDQNTVGDQQISFEEVVRRYNQHIKTTTNDK